jgi:hypothetical protein
MFRLNTGSSLVSPLIFAVVVERRKRNIAEPSTSAGCRAEGSSRSTGWFSRRLTGCASSWSRRSSQSLATLLCRHAEREQKLLENAATAAG